MNAYSNITFSGYSVVLFSPPPSAACDNNRSNLTVVLVPSRAPDLVTAYSPSNTSLVIKWSHVSEEHFQAKPVGYMIIYYPDGAMSNAHFMYENFATNTTTMTDLTVYTMYIIHVAAVSSGGMGPVNTVKVRTDATGTEVLKVASFSSMIPPARRKLFDQHFNSRMWKWMEPLLRFSLRYNILQPSP